MDRPAKSFLESLLLNDKKKTSVTTPTTTTVQRVHCPTCGSSAERYHMADERVIRTQCPCCDYLMILCSQTGKVIESYAPSLSPATLAALPYMTSPAS